MKSLKNKWKGTKITVNYLGNLDNQFGIKKKKILLEEDKLSPLSLFKSPIQQQEPMELHQGTAYFFNMRNNFEFIKIRDWEKDNNYYFLNYIKNMKYFDRVNNSKRILSNINFGKRRNNSTSLIFNKNPKRNKSKEYSLSIIKKNKNIKPILKLSNTNFKKNHLTKKTISKVISDYFEKSVYKDNKKINFNSNNYIYNQLKIFSPLTKKSNSKSNLINDTKFNNYLYYYNLNISSKNNKSKIYNLNIVNNNKLNETDKKRRVLSSKIHSFQSKVKNNNIKAIPIPKKSVEYIMDPNLNKFIKKSNTLIDASTNTE
jgi:hypothetical protein